MKGQKRGHSASLPPRRGMGNRAGLRRGRGRTGKSARDQCGLVGPITVPASFRWLPDATPALAGRPAPSHNRRIAIKKGDRLILSLGGRIAVECVAGNDERYKTVPLRRGHTWIIVNVRNVGRPGADSTP